MRGKAHLWTRGSVISTLVGKDLSKNTNQELGFSTSKSRVPVEATKQKKRKKKKTLSYHVFPLFFFLNNENQEVVDSRWL